MKQLLSRLKQAIRNWLLEYFRAELKRITILESELRELKKCTTSALLDVQYHRHGETQIIIASRLGHGFVKVIDIQLGDMHDLRNLVSSLEDKYCPGKYIVDAPPVAKELLRRCNHKWI